MGFFNKIKDAVKKGADHIVKEVKDEVVDKPVEAISKGIDHVNEEQQKIIHDAQKQAERIIADAKVQAAKIILKAKAEGIELLHNLENEFKKKYNSAIRYVYNKVQNYFYTKGWLCKCCAVIMKYKKKELIDELTKK